MRVQHAAYSVAEWSRQTYPAPLGAGGVGSIPANSDALNVPSFRLWRFGMKLSPFYSGGGAAQYAWSGFQQAADCTGVERPTAVVQQSLRQRLGQQLSDHA